MDKDEPNIRVRQEAVITLVCSVTLAFIGGLLVATALMSASITGMCTP